jgi:hypothetical protein
MSSPDCSDRCRCGIQPDVIGDDIEQVAIRLDGIDREDAQAA